MTAEQLINRKFLQLRILALQTRIAELEAQLASQKQEWILCSDRLPELVVRDDTPRPEVYGKAIAPSLRTQTVLVSTYDGHVRTDKWQCVEGSPGWWAIYGGRVRAWMPLPEALK